MSNKEKRIGDLVHPNSMPARRWIRTRKGGRTLDDIVIRAVDDECLPFTLRDIRRNIAERGGDDAQAMVDVRDTELIRAVARLVRKGRLEEYDDEQK